MPSEPIVVWWIGEHDAEDGVMEDTCTHVERVFGVGVTLLPGPDRPTGTFDAGRGQHRSVGSQCDTRPQLCSGRTPR